MRRPRAVLRMATAVSAVAGVAVFASPAMALTAGEPVTGTTLSSLSLTAGTGALFATNFSPGNTASSTGALTATDTNTSWTLQVADSTSTSNNGKMHATTGVTCTNSDSVLANALQVNLTAPVSLPTGGGVTVQPAVSISSTNQTVASASNQLLAANVFTTNYSQVIPSSEVMLTGCVYSLTSTYTLQ